MKRVEDYYLWRTITASIAIVLYPIFLNIFSLGYDESLKAYLAPTGLVSEPRGDLTCRGDLRLEVPKTV